MNKILLASLGAVVLAGASQAASVSYTATVPSSTTDFTSNFNLSQFNPSLGTLTSIDLKLVGSSTGSIQFESRDASAATITTNLSSTVSASGPANLTVTTLPLNSSSTAVSAYDGVTDFGGTSGRTFNNLTASDTQTTSLNSGFAPYIGNGNVVFTLTANGNSTVSGSGNLVTSISQASGGVSTITYNYTPAVPEPASMAVLSIGALGLIRRRNARKA